MKKVLGLLCILLLVTSACRKKYDFPDPSLKKIIGKWNWIQTSGGFTGATVFPAADGSNALSYEFTEKALCFVENAKNKTKFTYEINKATSLITKQPAWFLSLQQTGLKKYNKVGVAQDMIEFVGNDTLILSQDANDGQALFFVREK